MVIHFPSLDRTFLNVESEESDDELAVELEATAGPSGDVVPPSVA